MFSLKHRAHVSSFRSGLFNLLLTLRKLSLTDLTAATFGHENITNSLVTVNVSNPAKKAVRNIVDLSMFIRTRQSKGAVFYLGSLPGSVLVPEETFISAELDAGELLVRIQFNGTPEAYTVGGVKLNDGRNHLIQVCTRNKKMAEKKTKEENEIFLFFRLFVILLWFK